MASRMEKYYQNESSPTRSLNNQHLYDSIYENVTYTNVEEVVETPIGKEIDINKIKELLKKKEEASFRPIVKESRIEIKKEIEPLEDKNYDIRDILSKAKDEKESDQKQRSLSNTGYDILKNIKLKEVKEDENDLKDLINTITNTSILNKLGDKELSMNMLSELQSTDNTVIDESIASIISDAKKEEKLVEEEVVDKSFYTSSLGFKEEDFCDLNDINKNLKKNNLLIKTLLFIVVFIVISIIIYISYLLLK